MGNIFKALQWKCCLAKWQKLQNKYDQRFSTLLAYTHREKRWNFVILKSKPMYNLYTIEISNSKRIINYLSNIICVSKIFEHMCSIANKNFTYAFFIVNFFFSFHLISHSKCERRIFSFSVQISHFIKIFLLKITLAFDIIWSILIVYEKNSFMVCILFVIWIIFGFKWHEFELPKNFLLNLNKIKELWNHRKMMILLQQIKLNF